MPNSMQGYSGVVNNWKHACQTVCEKLSFARGHFLAWLESNIADCSAMHGAYQDRKLRSVSRS